ncbi:hypothetical protein BaRGS_00029579, partial [Batillaria attramentaria]
MRRRPSACSLPLFNNIELCGAAFADKQIEKVNNTPPRTQSDRAFSYFLDVKREQTVTFVVFYCSKAVGGGFVQPLTRRCPFNAGDKLKTATRK